MAIKSNDFLEEKNFNGQIIYLNKFNYVNLFRLTGLLVHSVNYHLRYYDIQPKINKTRFLSILRYFYCRLIYILFWFITIRQFALNFIDNRKIEKYLGDFSYYWTLNRTNTDEFNYRIYYIVPSCFLSSYNILCYTLFVNNEKHLNWIQPFLSILPLKLGKGPDLIDYRPYRIRIFIYFTFTFLITIVSTYFVCKLSFDTSKLIDKQIFILWSFWLALEIILFTYFISTNYLIVTYFSLVCAVFTHNFRILNKRFKQLGYVSRKDFDACVPLFLVKNAYRDHFKLSGMLENSNAFWCRYVFVTFFTLIPCSCYMIYNLFFGDLNEKLIFFYGGVLAHVTLMLLIICLSSISVHQQAHRCSIDAKRMSNFKMTSSMKINLLFLCRRLSKTTLGFKCFKFFDLTTFSISATSAIVASYFLIISDFTRSVPAARYYSRNP